jgi:phosphoribosyl 1,2-cyclic phosphate phosphodiesterase
MEIDGLNYVIDSGPDFRQQMLTYGVDTLEGLLFTHEHKDHVAGMDDIRAYNFLQKKPMSIYCSKDVLVALTREFSYVFNGDNYPGIPKVDVNIIENKPFKLETVDITPILVMHYKMPVFGFRVKNFVYVTDAKTIASKERDKMRGADILVINALRYQEHISHFNLDEALALIQDVQPKQAYLTHISHLFDTHQRISEQLPPNVHVAYDGLTFEL